MIDHISEIVRDSKDEDGQTNFQKSSCTLDAGVKIYASRVDSFHNETFKMLGGMNKVTQSNEAENCSPSLAILHPPLVKWHALPCNPSPLLRFESNAE